MSADQGGQILSERSDCFGTVEDEDVKLSPVKLEMSPEI
jgi:hypothetical protein